MARALKITFLEARKAYLRIARRLTLCPDSHRDRRVSCSIPSRAARRGEDCLPFKPRLVLEGMFLQAKRLEAPGAEPIPGVSPGGRVDSGDPPLRIDNRGLYSVRTLFSSLLAAL